MDDSRVQTFFLEPTDRVELRLRRYSGGPAIVCPGSPFKYHNADTPLGQAAAIWVARESWEQPGLDVRPEFFPHDDPRWPTVCAGCPYQFAENDPWQVCQDLIYRRRDTGAEVTLRNAPWGATWYSDWMLCKNSNRWRGPDGHSLTVRVPGPGNGHDWCPDGTCSNCTMPDDTEHRCWCRSGNPPDANVTVNKDGRTCGAGGGSILTPHWHGFLRDGILIKA